MQWHLPLLWRKTPTFLRKRRKIWKTKKIKKRKSLSYRPFQAVYLRTVADRVIEPDPTRQHIIMVLNAKSAGRITSIWEADSKSLHAVQWLLNNQIMLLDLIHFLAKHNLAKHKIQQQKRNIGNWPQSSFLICPSSSCRATVPVWKQWTRLTATPSTSISDLKQKKTLFQVLTYKTAVE